VSTWGRTKEEAVLVAVAGGAAAVAVTWILRSQPTSILAWTMTATALGLALSAAFAFWFAGAVRRLLAHETDALRNVVSALPDGLLVVENGRVLSVNRRLCDLLGYERDELVGAEEPFPFWPPECRHEHERWHARLGSASEPVSLVFLHRDSRRLPALVAAGEIPGGGGTGRYVLTVRDVSATHRRVKRLAELSTRDAVTGLLNERGFEERLRDAVRRALTGQTNVAVALLELGDDLDTPEGLIVVDRLRALVRAGEDLGRTRAAEVAWILPETAADGALEAVARVVRELDRDAVVVNAGVCDLAAAGDALALYALAGQALAHAKARGDGATVRHQAVAPAPLRLGTGSRSG
jgi:PAS domain S-box-containing protein